MSEESNEVVGTKRKLEEMNETDEQISSEITDESPVKKVKSSNSSAYDEEVQSSNDENAFKSSDAEEAGTQPGTKPNSSSFDDKEDEEEDGDNEDDEDLDIEDNEDLDIEDNEDLDIEDDEDLDIEDDEDVDNEDDDDVDNEDDDDDEEPQSNSSTQPNEPEKREQVATLITGCFYRVLSLELGHFFIKAGVMGSFRVNASNCYILDREDTVVFPIPNAKLNKGMKVEVKDNLSGATTVTLITPGRAPQPEPKNWLTRVLSAVTPGSSDNTEKLDEPPLQVAGLVDSDILIIDGVKSTVVNGTGRNLICSGPGTVTVQGNLRSIVNTDTAHVKVNGKVTAGILQTSTGSVVVTKDVIGNITNSGGGSIEVMGMHGSGGGEGIEQLLVNSNGKVWIGTGKNNGGTWLYSFGWNGHRLDICDIHRRS